MSAQIPFSHIRNETPIAEFNNEGKDVTQILTKKRQKHLQGCSSLIGKIAENIINYMFKADNQIFYLPYGDSKRITFSNFGHDIIANFGSSSSSYEAIVKDMTGSGENNPNIAWQMLTNLSLSYNHNPQDLFNNLGPNSCKLMAVLICETIRFRDDGACARWAIRLALLAFYNQANGFEWVFGNEEYEPFAIFANDGGKQRILSQIAGYENKANDPYFEEDLKNLQGSINFFSDYEEENNNDENENNNDENSNGPTFPIPNFGDIDEVSYTPGPEWKYTPQPKK